MRRIASGEAVLALALACVGCMPGGETKRGPGPGEFLVATAGPDQVVPRRSTVALAGWSSLPGTFAWRQTAGPQVLLQGANTASPSFTAPDVESWLAFELTVTSGLATAAASTNVLVRNQAPVISGLALTPASPLVTDAVSVSAVATDPDLDPVVVSYAWKRNGAVIPGATAPTLPPRSAERGDVVTAVVSATDGLLTADAEVSTTVRDMVFTLQATPPTRADYGARVEFPITAVAADGTPPGIFALDYGPAGMTVSPNGLVSWTAALPMFDRAIEVHWRVSLAAFPSNRLEGTIRVEDPLRQLPLFRYGTEIPIWPSGIQVSDLDGDGRAEMLVASRRGLAELGLSGGVVAQRWAYPFFPAASGATGAVAAADVDGDGRADIFLAVGDALVRIDGATRREDARGAFSCVDLKVADLEPDGALEVVCLAGTSDPYAATGRIVVLDAATLGVKWQTPDLALGRALAVGNVDASATLEIVTAGGFVFDGATGANRWAYGPGFGHGVAVGDLDGDGVAEIVGVTASGTARGFSAVTKAQLWELTGYFGAVSVADLDGDGIAEVIVGNDQWGYVTAYRYVPATNALDLVFQVDSQDDGVTSIGVGDLDGDGLAEVVWGSGAVSSGADVLAVAGRHPAWAVEWTNLDPRQLDGPFVGAKPARLAGGAVRILYGVPSTDSGYAGYRIASLDPATGAVAVSPEVGSNWSRAGALDAADVDGDGVDEALIATANLYDGYLAAFDLGSGAAKWTSGTIGTGIALAHADLSGDGVADLVALVAAAAGGIYAYDLRSQVLLGKTSGPLQGAAMVVADLDGDGVPEVVALSADHLQVFRRDDAGPAGLVEQATAAVSGGTDVAVADGNGDGVPEIYVLSSAYWYGAARVSRYDAALAPLGSFELGVAAQSLHVEQLGFARQNLVLGIGDSWYGSAPGSLRAVDPVTGAEIWRSPALWGGVPRSSLSYVDVSGDEIPEIAFGTTGGMYLTR